MVSLRLTFRSLPLRSNSFSSSRTRTAQTLSPSRVVRVAGLPSRMPTIRPRLVERYSVCSTGPALSPLRRPAERVPVASGRALASAFSGIGRSSHSKGGAPMKTVAILVASSAAVLVFAGSPAIHAAKHRSGAGGGDDSDPNHAVARTHGGHVWVRADALPTSDGSRLSAWLAGHAPKGDITAKTKEAPWSINYLAVFKKPAVPGAMTVQ